MFDFVSGARALGALSQAYGLQSYTDRDGSTKIVTGMDTFICLAPDADRDWFYGSFADFSSVQGELSNPADVARLVEALAARSADLSTDYHLPTS